MGEDEEALATEDGFGPVDRGRLLDQVRLPMAAFDPVRNASGEIVDFSWAYANEAALALTTFRWDDVVGRNFSDTVPLEAGVSLAGYINAYETGSSFTAEMPFSGRPFDGWLAIRAERIDDLMVTRFEDVTEVKRLAGEKDEALATVQKVLGRITDAMYAVDRDWRFTMLNASAERLLGRSADELIGKVLGIAFPAGVGSDIDRPFRRALATGEASSFEAYYPEPLDSWYRIRLYPDADGLTVHFSDIGAERRVQAQMARYDRLEAAATVAGGIAHDFNNLLMVVAGHASFLAEDLPSGHPGHEDLRAIEEATRRATALTRQLLSYTSQQTVNPQQLDLSSSVIDLRARIEQKASPNITVEVFPSDEPAPVEIDPIELERLIEHLVDNAVAAMPDGGRLVIEVSTAYIDDEMESSSADRPAGHYGVVAVSDDGTGMSPDVLDRAMDPFFTTRRAQGDTGLGLSAAHGIARQAGGHVVLYSEPGLGTTVRVFLKSSSTAVPPRPADTDDLTGTETVLLVDDNAEVAGVARRSLFDAGYRVITVSGPNEALERVRIGAHEDVALLVTDVVMPDMNGIELSDAVRSEIGQIPVLFVSGYTERSIAADGASRPAVEFLAKPFTRSELLRSVRRLIDHHPRGS